MDDRKIFECIAKKQPGVRAVQISDLLDAPLAEVSEALRELVETGELVRKPGFAPNGTQAQLYDFSEAFKASNDYKALMAPVGTPAAAVAAPAPAPVPTPAKRTDDAPSIAERLVQHILKTGGATDEELRAALGLKYTIYPSSYLAHARSSGRVTKRGNKWIPADGRAPVVAPTPTPATSVDVPVFLAGHVPTPAADKPNGGAGKSRKVVVEPTPAPAPVIEAAPAPEPEPAPVLRCGVWSDGVVELQRNGKTVAVLTQVEADFMSQFLARVPAAI